MKYICTVFVTVLLLIACNNKQPQQNGNNAALGKETALNSSWNVKGCAEPRKENTKSAPVADEFDLPEFNGESSIKASGDSIVYTRFARHGCCRHAKLSTSQSDNVITVTEYWWGQICKCMCSSTLSATIRNLPKGEYTVYGVETGTDPITDKPADGKDTVLQKKIIIQ